ncbi:lymphocyte antigen 6E-like [Discoglossus pictus]
MEALKVVLLVTALCIGTAYSLSCYTCTGEISNANCMTATNCTVGMDSYCMTSVASASVVGVSAGSITKECTAFCSPTNIGFLGVSSSVSCCSTNLCNVSGASSVKTSYAMLVLSVGLLLALVKNSSL